MTILDNLITLAQITGSIDVQCSFNGDWYVRHNHNRTQGVVHIVTHGTGYLKLDNEAQARQLQAGDIIFFPRNAAHTLSSQIGCNNTQHAPSISQQGGITHKQTNASANAAQLNLYCAHFAYETHNSLLQGLPEIIILNTPHSTTQAIVSLLQYEISQNEHSTTAAINALSTVLLVHILRTHLSQNEHQAPLTGVLNGWRDRRLRSVVQAVTQEPERDWRVETLAELAKLSRAQLMRLFRSQMQTSPHAFVNNMRLQKAAMLLRNSQNTVLAVALESGYQSETHFGKVFKKHYGCTPKQYRQQRITAETLKTEDYSI